MNRRDVLKLATALLGTAASSSLGAALHAGLQAAPGGASGVNRIFDAAQRESVRMLCDLIIPPTDTPGAVDAGVPDFVAEIVADWYNAQERETFFEGLSALDAHALARDQQRFHLASPETRLAGLSEQAETGGGTTQSTPFFQQLREIVVLGYFTSEVGATQALAYLPMPGHYDGEYDVARVGRSFTH